jgi:DNA-binding SARP family transcriptional activator
VDEPARVVDLHGFRDLCARARGQSDDPQAARLLAEALELWHEQALTGVSSEWVEAERDRLEQERAAARHDLVDARLRLGQGGNLVGELAAWAAAHPLDERVAGHYMLALQQTGRIADALAHYRTLRERLVEELGTDPGAALRDLHGRILAAESTTPAPEATAPVVLHQLPAAPVLFTGRTAELAELDRVLSLTRGTAAVAMISAIAGTGGVGKT